MSRFYEAPPDHPLPEGAGRVWVVDLFDDGVMIAMCEDAPYRKEPGSEWIKLTDENA